jgi:beta-glucosidase
MRNRMVPFILLAILTATAIPAARARTGPVQAGGPQSDQQVTTRVEALLKQMTLEEKVGQLNQAFFMSSFMKPEMVEDGIRKGEIGSFLFITDPAITNRLQRVAVEQSRLKIPLLFGFDVIHGFRTIFPVPLAMAASWDTAMIEQAQTAAAREASAVGIRWTFAPMVDIARDPRWGRIVEGAGEDPYLGSAVARAQVRGFQGPQIGSPEHLLACAKHFAGYGAADGGRDYDSTYIPDSQMHNVYLPPFHAAVEAGVGSLMAAYQDLNDVPASGNRFLLQDVLRRDWGFRGFVVSDFNSVQDLATHGFASDAADAAYRGLTAGVDMDMASKTYATHVAKLVKDGKIPASVLDDTVRAILAAKVRLGLFENPYVDEARAKQVVGAEEHRKLARLAAQRSAVLLRNQNNALPIDRAKTSSIAVIGPLADAQKDIQGSWSLAANSADAITVLQGIRNSVATNVKVEHAPGVQIKRVYPSMFDAFFPGPKVTPWTDAQSEEEFKKAVDLANRSDVAVMVLGELESMSGEGASRSTLELPGRQQQLLEAVVATRKPVVLVLLNGRPLDLRWASEHVPAILTVWYPGTEGGNAVADLLFGDAVPSGKLPVTWPRTVGQVPIYYAHNRTHQPDTNQGFTSRYWDIPSSPLYPFGYGLSYTTFAYSNLRVGKPEAKLGDTIEVAVDVENTGNRSAETVAQLYIHQKSGSASRPVRELKGFRKIMLAKGEKATLRFTLGKAELSYWSGQERKWVQEPAEFELWAGEDSTAPLQATFKVVP